MKRSSVVALALVFLAGGTVAARAESAQWREYAYPADGFAVSSPRQPEFSKQDTPGAGGIVELHQYGVQMANDTGFMVIAATLHPSDQRGAGQVLTDAKNGGAKAIDGKIVADRAISLGKFPGVEVEVVAKDYHARARYFLVARTLYQVISIAPTAQPILAETDRFYKSFHLVKPSP